MKPITDDDVHSILKGLEKRERRRKAAEVKRISLPDRVLGSLGNRRVISFDLAKQQARRTVSGVFCYVARG